MRRSLLASAALCAAALLAAGTTHAACTIVATADGPRLTGCELGELTRNRFEGSIDRAVGDRLRLRMPNLKVENVDISVIGLNASVTLDLRNDGNLAAGPFLALAIASLHNPLAAGTIVGAPMMLPVQPVVGLDIGRRARASMGVLSLPDRNQDWDVCVASQVDPTWGGGPAWAAVYESNETDNQRHDCCRIYGPKPDTASGPGSCF